MPFMQMMANRTSCLFNGDDIGSLDIGCLDTANSLAELLRILGIAQSDAEIAMIGHMPGLLQRTCLETIRYSLQPPGGASRIPITVSWSPAYDWAVKLWEAHAVEGSPTAITVHIEGPYPDDC